MDGQPSSPPSPEPGLDFGEKVVVLAGGILAALAMTAITAVLPLIEKNLAHTATDAMLVKQMIGGVSLAMVIGSPLGGYLVDRLGMRPVLLACLLLYGLAGSAGLYLSSLPLLLASRLLLGLAAAAIQIISMTLINTRLDGNDRARWMGLYVSIATLSTFVINPAGGALGEIGWRWPFALYALGLLVFLLVLPGGGAAHSAAKAADEAGSSSQSLFKAFPWHYLPLSLTIGAMMYVPAIYGPFLLREVAGFGPGGIAAVLTAMAALGAAMAFFYGRARSVISVHAAFAVSFMLCGAGALIAGLATGLPVLIAGMAVHSLGVAWLVPNIMTSLGSKVEPSMQARAAGLVKAAHFLAAPIFVLAVEPVAQRYGAAAAMIVTAACGFALIIALGLRIAGLKRSAAPAPL